MERWNLSKNETIAKIFNFFVDGEIFACYISKTKNSSYGISVNILDKNMLHLLEERRKISGKTTLDSPAIQIHHWPQMYHAVQTKEDSSRCGKTAIFAVNQHLVFSHLLPGHFSKKEVMER